MPTPFRTYSADMPWAIVSLKNQLFALPSQDLREILQMPETAEVPGAPAYIRGVINLRGRVIPVMDLRKRLGLPSALEEIQAFCGMMQQREQDHRNWLNELEASVRQRRPFGLTTDPHQCAFGKWYDSYHAGNVWVAALLRKFDKPHQQIHAIAGDVERLKDNQQYEQAQQVIARTRDGLLAGMVKLFAELRDLVRSEQRETAMVLAQGNKLLGVTVDAAQSIERLLDGSIEEISPLVPIACDGVVRRHARTAKANDVILLVETDRLMASAA